MTSVEVTVTVLVPVASTPPVVGVIGMVTFPFVAIDKRRLATIRDVRAVDAFTVRRSMAG